MSMPGPVAGLEPQGHRLALAGGHPLLGQLGPVVDGVAQDVGERAP